jgi:SAM-dependent methyltransferase
MEEWFPGIQITAIEPARLRAQTARRALTPSATVLRGLAPAILAPLPESAFDVVLMLDVTHLIPTPLVDQTLNAIRTRLRPGGQFIARVNVPQPQGQSLIWHIDWCHRLLTRARTYHRPLASTRALIEAAGFEIRHSTISGGKPEMVWLVASPITRCVGHASPPAESRYVAS